MAPAFWNRTNPCVTTPSINVTTPAEDFESSHQALLYIVVTLLFYSIGIIIGIITYLKREREEMEEEKVFDDLLMLKKDPFQAFRSVQVQAVAAHLEMLEEKKRLREANGMDCLARPSSLKLEVKSPSLRCSRTPSPKSNEIICSKCKKKYRPHFYMDRVHWLSDRSRRKTSFDFDWSKNISGDDSLVVGISRLFSAADTFDSSTGTKTNMDPPRLDVTCTSTPSSACNRSMDDVFYTPPDSNTNIVSDIPLLRRESEMDDNDEAIKSISTPLLTPQRCVETNV